MLFIKIVLIFKIYVDNGMMVLAIWMVNGKDGEWKGWHALFLNDC
jgi:hypothetical protein